MTRTFAFATLAFCLSTATAYAHCDRVDGPVVADARIALETRSAAPAAKWIAPADERALQEALDLALAVRDRDEASRRLADRFFFETVVRLHRASEGEPFTGLQDGGEPLPPALAAADRALASGELGDLPAMLSEAVVHGLHARFARALEAKAGAGASVEAGRRFTEAYAELVTWIVRVDEAAHGAESTH